VISWYTALGGGGEREEGGGAKTHGPGMGEGRGGATRPQPEASEPRMIGTRSHLIPRGLKAASDVNAPAEECPVAAEVAVLHLG
jgi:hypothetical protein